MSAENDKDLEMAEELFRFLQGEPPKGCKIRLVHLPRLNAEQAWCVIWWLGNQFRAVSDSIGRCDVCGSLFHTEQGGEILDFGRSPYIFCEGCVGSDEYAKKERSRANLERKK